MSQANPPVDDHGWDDDTALDALLQVADLRFEQAIRDSLNLARGMESIIRPEPPPRAESGRISNGLGVDNGHNVSWSSATASGIVATETRSLTLAATARRTRTVEEPQLSEQDIALLATIASGVTADVAARRLEVSARTLRRRLRAICNRLEVTTPIQAVVWAARRQLI